MQRLGRERSVSVVHHNERFKTPLKPDLTKVVALLVGILVLAVLRARQPAVMVERPPVSVTVEYVRSVASPKGFVILEGQVKNESGRSVKKVTFGIFAQSDRFKGVDYIVLTDLANGETRPFSRLACATALAGSKATLSVEPTSIEW